MNHENNKKSFIVSCCDGRNINPVILFYVVTV